MNKATPGPCKEVVMGPTPHGGVYMVSYYFNSKYTPVPRRKQRASLCTNTMKRTALCGGIISAAVPTTKRNTPRWKRASRPINLSHAFQQKAGFFPSFVQPDADRAFFGPRTAERTPESRRKNAAPSTARSERSDRSDKPENRGENRSRRRSGPKNADGRTRPNNAAEKAVSGEKRPSNRPERTDRKPRPQSSSAEGAEKTAQSANRPRRRRPPRKPSNARKNGGQNGAPNRPPRNSGPKPAPKE